MRPDNRNGSSRIRAVFGFACTIFATLSLDCRKLTAEPAAQAKPLEVAETLYEGSLKPGWQDWGWGSHDLTSGAARINLSQYGGWILHHDVLSTQFSGLVFRMFAPSSYGNFLQVQLANGDDKSLPVIQIGTERERQLPGGWAEVTIPWSELNPAAAPFDRITFHARSPVGSDWVLFDHLVFTGLATGSPSAPSSPAAGGKPVRLSVDCRGPGHPISPYIYGIAGEYAELGATARRWGGNPTTRYNWQAGAVNAGKDWYFENGRTDGYSRFLSDNQAQHMISALTVPMIGWVAKDTSSVGFPVSVYGAQRATDPNRPDAGDGVRPGGANVAPKSPSLTSVAAPPDMMQKWVEAIRRQDEKTKARSVGLYILDNEPNLWNSTHRDAHPDPLTYDELLDRTIRYGTAIRTADPQALIAGPAEWGWPGYMDSAADAMPGVFLHPDRRAHGDMALIPWYLKKLHEHDTATGVRVLNVLDVHYYPQENGVYGSAADATTAALRLRSTRSLWDPSYKDESWINDTVRLIPRLKEWVQQNYPGLAISIGEYNFGGEQHMSGGLALAEVLGRFGVGGIDYAFYWLAPPKGTPAYWAFRAYRNFDGKGGQFLGRSMDTRMDTNVSLFASRDASGKHLVLIALNLDPAKPAATSIGLNGCSAIATQHEYAYSGGAQGFVDEGVKSGADLNPTLAPYSISVFDIVLK
jgi:hypothetical protein